MTDAQATDLITPHADSIRRIVESHGAPFDRLAITGAVNTRQRHAGCVARVTVVFGPSEQWTRDYHEEQRQALKRDLRKHIEDATGKRFAVHLQATS